MDELFDVFDGPPPTEPSEAPPVAPAPTPAVAAAAAAPSSSGVPADTIPTNPEKHKKRDKGDKKERRKEKDKTRKRKADGHLKNGNGADESNGGGGEDVDMDGAAGAQQSSDVDEDMEVDGGAAAAAAESSPQAPKRRRKESDAQPVLTDEFTTAESRQVAANAGFTATAKSEESLTLAHNIQHQVALPPDLDYDYVPLANHQPPAEPARKYSFKLDPFQSLSVASIERGESVLVSAHTSAGKTVVAEYAIAQCLKNNQRVIYTSPIKALSNQKYRDFQAEFGDVGLMTGDVTINPTASCLVMTTEILRSMLYRGSEIMREVAWVVFDEIHYLRDKSRGVVWEETIILLPDKVRYVFLSATIPNAFQFAEWIAKIHRQACHVVYTDFRPTPLQNYLFPAGGEGIFLIVDEKSVFKEKNFNTAMALIEQAKGADPSDPNARMKGKGRDKKMNKGGQRAQEGSDISKIIRMIMKKSFQPVIVFSFSKRECEAMALNISQMTFNSDTEKGLVNKVFSTGIGTLADVDRELPQITHILPLLERGIGVHHSGLLPLLKEIIEILFQEGLIKVLFATETFSIGLNMPAKTVVFTQVTKWDGVATRPLTSSEYIQMSGRAGRRGLDDRGIVIMMMDDKLEPETVKAIVAGQQDRLNSAFHLGYNMVLNLQRIETVSPEYMLERCFYQFQNAASVPALEKDLMTLQQERDNLSIPDEDTVKEYYGLHQQLETYTKDMISVIQHPTYCLEFLQAGRLAQIKTPTGEDFDWGVIINFVPRKSPAKGEADHSPQESYLIDVLLKLDGESASFQRISSQNATMPPGVVPFNEEKSETARYEVVPCLLTCVAAFSKLRIFVKPKLDTEEDMKECGRNLEETKRRFPDGLPILDPIVNMHITDQSFKQLLRKIEVLESKLLANNLYGSPELPELWEQYASKVELGSKIKEKKKLISKAHTIAQLDELKSRKRVLRRLGFINDAEVVQLKARVACEISSTEGHELLLSELIFNGFFTDLSPELIAAVLSVFVFDEKSEATELREELRKPFGLIKSQARIIAKVSQESKLDVNEDEYVESLKWQLMETVYAWAQGRTFAEICKMTNTYEGGLVRVFRRLEELLRQMAGAAKVMGSEDLQKKFEESLKLIRRDIVSCASLYL